ncbi:MAG: YfiR family protein [Proteobacteria bacterium]|nr:YfiR family protein [Pseudomonadota bacterium]
MLMCRALGRPLSLLLCLVLGAGARADELPEYRVKAAFLYNFMVFTEWPDNAAPDMTLCIVGDDPFGAAIDGLTGKRVADKPISVERVAAGASLSRCRVVFITASAIDGLDGLLAGLGDQAVLTVADSAGAMQRGVQLNMRLTHSKVTFEANLDAARRHRLQLSSKLLRLATEVQR